ncbi:MAG: pseudouridine synthase [Lachnospiraceae bacterium]|nr:pseudouridine synthase [Lachnospiraceae bacterium]
MRLDKFLADMNAGTRSEIKKAIRKGLVQVDGTMVKNPGEHVTEASAVSYDGRQIPYEPFSYYMLNKPQGVITATEDRRQQTVLDLLPADRRRDLSPVGRLDKDTEGLLLITNDGDLNHRLLSPRSHVGKRYFARIQGVVDTKDVEAFANGLLLPDGLRCLPAKLEILSSGETSEIEIVIEEGKFHQIKRMFEAVGKRVIYLKRLSMGSLTLDPALPTGQWRRLTETEVRNLKDL